MLNPFEISGKYEHCPANFARAFEEIGDVTVNTESLLASKSKMFSASENSEKKSGNSLWNKSIEEEKGLNLADLTSNDTFAISKSSEISGLLDSKSLKPPRPGINEKLGNSGQTVKSENKASGDKIEVSFGESIEKSSKAKKNHNNWTNTSKLLHCKTCKCLEGSHSSIKPLENSESLRFLSQLESFPSKTAFEGHEVPITTRFTQNKPYTSPLFNNAMPPSQIFRQRINSHILNSKLNRQVSMPVFTFKS